MSLDLIQNMFSPKKENFKNFYSQPFKHWKSGCGAFKDHVHGKKRKQDPTYKSTQSLHSRTGPILNEIFGNIDNEQRQIDALIDRNLQTEVAENRKKLKPIIDTVITLGRLGLPLRAHRDDSKYHPELGHYANDTSVGNFIEMLNFRVRSGDRILKDHLSTCAKNASYISKETTNEFIACCGEAIRELIVKEIKENRFYSILADEASDCSNQEQFSLVIRFVDSNHNVREEF